MSVNWEHRFYSTLKRIAAYHSPQRLRRRSDREYGLAFEEAIEMAYENMQSEARAALKGYRRPTAKSTESTR